MHFKFALISHVLPPSSSGQAIVLYKLLNDLPASYYCLLSRQKYNPDDVGVKLVKTLPARYFFLKQPRQIPSNTSNLITSLSGIINLVSNIVCRAWQVVKIVKIEHCNTIVACSGDLADLPAAFLASRISGVPLVTYLFDDFVYQWTGAKRRLARLIEPVIIKGTSTVIVPNESLQIEYRHRYNVECKVVRNPCIMSRKKDLGKSNSIFMNQDINIVYTGSVYHAHYDSFLRLIAGINKSTSKTIKLHIFTDQPQSVLKTNGIVGNCIVYHSHVPNDKVSPILDQADILFLPLAFDSPIPEVIRTSAPGKLGEYLSSGTPILAHVPSDTFVAWFINKHRCGLVIDHKDANKSLKQSMTSFHDRSFGKSSVKVQYKLQKNILI